MRMALNASALTSATFAASSAMALTTAFAKVELCGLGIPVEESLDLLPRHVERPLGNLHRCRTKVPLLNQPLGTHDTYSFCSRRCSSPRRGEEVIRPVASGDVNLGATTRLLITNVGGGFPRGKARHAVYQISCRSFTMDWRTLTILRLLHAIPSMKNKKQNL